MSYLIGAAVALGAALIAYILKLRSDSRKADRLEAELNLAEALNGLEKLKEEWTRASEAYEKVRGEEEDGNEKDGDDPGPGAA